jgi:septin family protein
MTRAVTHAVQLRQLSLRSNVLPILTRTDGLTASELDTVRSAVKRDLAKAFPNDGGFGIFAHEDEEEAEHVKVSNDRQLCLP